VRLITEGESFAILRDISPVSRGVGECFECTEIRGQLEAAVKGAIQILNDATDEVCDMDDAQFGTEIERMIQQIHDTSTYPSENAQAFDNLAQNFKSLADAYKLIIKGGCEDPQATKHKLVRALQTAAYTLSSAAFSHTDADNHADAAKAHENSAALYQGAAKIYGASRKKIYGTSSNIKKRVEALWDAANALYSAAASHTRAGHQADAAKAYEKCTALNQEVAQIFGELEDRERQAAALKSAVRALSSAASLHTNVGSHTDAAKAHEKLAALYQETAEIYGALRNIKKRSEALWDAANALFSAALSHTDAGNHAAAAKAHEKRTALGQEVVKILSNPRYYFIYPMACNIL
jgi:tetratricopeptide (TPR) repeat protein